MKVSVAAALLFISSVSAFNVSYLNQIGGASGPAKAAPPVNTNVRRGSGYLDSFSGPAPVAPVPVAPAPFAPAPVAPAPVASAPSSSGTSNYSSGLASNTPLSGGGLTGYLSALGTSTSLSGGAGLSTYANSMSGGGRSASYTPPAPATAVASVPKAAAPTNSGTSNFSSRLASNTPLSGPGLLGYTSGLGSNAVNGSGAALQGYLSVLGSNAAGTSGAGLSGYLDAVGTSQSAAGSSPVDAFLESVYSQIQALPGASVPFNASNEKYSMTFSAN